ncbi:MAG: PaaI family thioesterase [Acidobacteria bacterium]|nr:PaaI family thioesterase [Acidobacteriota bacterium]
MEVDNYCFCCGRDNPRGMKLDIRSGEDGEVYTLYTPPAEFQGYQGVVHGGILATLMDEIMAHALLRRGMGSAATARMEVVFRHPARTGVELRICGRVEDVSGRRITTTAVIADADGRRLAEARALFLRILRN